MLLTELAKAADIVLPGASWIEKDATYVNKDGRLQASARAMSSPGEAQDDWKILTDVGLALGAAIAYPTQRRDSRRARRRRWPATRPTPT